MVRVGVARVACARGARGSTVATIFLSTLIIAIFSASFYTIAAIGRVFPCRPHGRSSISNFIYRALDVHVSTGIVTGTVPMTIPVDTCPSSAE